jgi:hypothetical protein
MQNWLPSAAWLYYTESAPLMKEAAKLIVLFCWWTRSAKY